MVLTSACVSYVRPSAELCRGGDEVFKGVRGICREGLCLQVRVLNCGCKRGRGAGCGFSM